MLAEFIPGLLPDRNDLIAARAEYSARVREELKQYYTEFRTTLPALILEEANKGKESMTVPFEQLPRISRAMVVSEEEYLRNELILELNSCGYQARTYVLDYSGPVLEIKWGDLLC